ncbi:MAG: hypothetical protein R2746_05400 [Acidimicrobiales bacterium]
MAVLAVLVVVNVGLAGLRGLVGGEPGGPASSSFGTGGDGLEGYADLLRAEGHPVTRLRTRPTADDLPPSATVVLADPSQIGTEEGRAAVVPRGRRSPRGGRRRHGAGGGRGVGWRRHPGRRVAGRPAGVGAVGRHRRGRAAGRRRRRAVATSGPSSRWPATMPVRRW